VSCLTLSTAVVFTNNGFKTKTCARSGLSNPPWNGPHWLVLEPPVLAVGRWASKRASCRQRSISKSKMERSWINQTKHTCKLCWRPLFSLLKRLYFSAASVRAATASSFSCSPTLRNLWCKSSCPISKPGAVRSLLYQLLQPSSPSKVSRLLI
jgi:hypothetical protein